MNFFNKLKKIKEDYKVPEKGNVSDKTLTYRMLVGAIGMFICMICIVSTSIAYFSTDEGAQGGAITASNCFITPDVVLLEGDTELPVTGSKGVFDLEEGKSYAVYLKARGTAESGYCTVLIGGKEHHTDDVLIVPEGSDYVYKFILNIESGTGSVPKDAETGEPIGTAKLVKVEILSRWGYYNGKPDIVGGRSYTLNPDLSMTDDDPGTEGGNNSDDP